MRPAFARVKPAYEKEKSTVAENASRGLFVESRHLFFAFARFLICLRPWSRSDSSYWSVYKYTFFSTEHILCFFEIKIRHENKKPSHLTHLKQIRTSNVEECKYTQPVCKWTWTHISNRNHFSIEVCTQQKFWKWNINWMSKKFKCQRTPPTIQTNSHINDIPQMAPFYKIHLAVCSVSFN